MKRRNIEEKKKEEKASCISCMIIVLCCALCTYISVDPSIHPFIRPPLKYTYTYPFFRAGQAIVVLSELLEHEINLGYEGFKNSQLLKFNGQFIKNLRHLSQLLDGNKEPQIIFEFHPHQLLVLDCEDAHRASLEICHTHSIPATKSKDLLEDVHKIDNVAPGDNFPTYDHL